MWLPASTTVLLASISGLLFCKHPSPPLAALLLVDRSCYWRIALCVCYKRFMHASTLPISRVLATIYCTCSWLPLARASTCWAVLRYQGSTVWWVKGAVWLVPAAATSSQYELRPTVHLSCMYYCVTATVGHRLSTRGVQYRPELFLRTQGKQIRSILKHQLPRTIAHISLLRSFTQPWRTHAWWHAYTFCSSAITAFRSHISFNS